MFGLHCAEAISIQRKEGIDVDVASDGAFIEPDSWYMKQKRDGPAASLSQEASDQRKEHPTTTGTAAMNEMGSNSNESGAAVTTTTTPATTDETAPAELAGLVQLGDAPRRASVSTTPAPTTAPEAAGFVQLDDKSRRASENATTPSSTSTNAASADGSDESLVASNGSRSGLLLHGRHNVGRTMDDPTTTTTTTNSTSATPPENANLAAGKHQHNTSNHRQSSRDRELSSSSPSTDNMLQHKTHHRLKAKWDASERAQQLKTFLAQQNLSEQALPKPVYGRRWASNDGGSEATGSTVYPLELQASKQIFVSQSAGITDTLFVEVKSDSTNKSHMIVHSWSQVGVLKCDLTKTCTIADTLANGTKFLVRSDKRICGETGNCLGFQPESGALWLTTKGNESKISMMDVRESFLCSSVECNATGENKMNPSSDVVCGGDDGCTVEQCCKSDAEMKNAPEEASPKEASPKEAAGKMDASAQRSSIFVLATILFFLHLHGQDDAAANQQVD